MHEKPRVLIVDNEEIVRTFIGKALPEFPCEILGSASGEDALVYLDEQSANVDFIPLDVMMPGLNEFEVLDILNANPQTSRIKVIMLTAMTQVEDKVKALSSGASDYIVKPFEKEEMIAQIDLQLRLKPAEEKLFKKYQELHVAKEKLRELNQRLEKKFEERTSEIARLLEQKQSFISQLANDLRTPLTPMVALLPTLRDRQVEYQPRQMAEMAVRNVEFMEDLVEKRCS